MSKRFIIAGALALNSLMVPFALAEDAPATPSSLSKEEFYSRLESVFPNMLCTGIAGPEAKKEYPKLEITVEECSKMIPDSMKACKERLDASVPETITAVEADQSGQKIAHCVAQDIIDKSLKE